MDNRIEVCADILSEFLEVAIHCILHCRGVYPQGVFGRRKKYNVPVQICLHPEVSKYITNVTTSVKSLLKDCGADKVSIVIVSADGRPLERFVFDISYNTDRMRSDRDDDYLLHLEQSLRALLLKLNVSDALLQPLPTECSWTVHVHTRESSASKLEESQNNMDFPWVEAEEREVHMNNSHIVPLRSLKSQLFKVQLFAEESRDKK
ncbi:LOW QUALITY PROTEIN: mitotic spindle assembly checkpoint protein MAD2B-like [Pomacea canaliculata]|uniref:LOW QUALITY PROTEIN: mitotic spindle assembly checkpoint protein MAD2B-like n=1 Tax=Pomacea canaliculata TaxID=400727 RepID=UPI000D730918|nr:LOW QUALITY PROTEIN: mitotic spindle assembly checkpoint protein MAD2B-like [Pomacea canaliculata]